MVDGDTKLFVPGYKDRLHIYMRSKRFLETNSLVYIKCAATVTLGNVCFLDSAATVTLGNVFFLDSAIRDSEQQKKTICTDLYVVFFKRDQGTSTYVYIHGKDGGSSSREIRLVPRCGRSPCRPPRKQKDYGGGGRRRGEEIFRPHPYPLLIIITRLCVRATFAPKEQHQQTAREAKTKVAKQNKKCFFAPLESCELDDSPSQAVL